MPWIAPAAIAGGSIAGGLIGNAKASADRDAARAAYEQSVKDLEAIGIPTVEAQKVVLEQYQSQGKLTPELEESIKLGDSNMLGISTDGTSKEAQLRALAKLGEVGDSGGMTASDRATMEQTQGDIDAADRGHREAAMSKIRARGQLGSGLELLAGLSGGQENTTARHMAGLTAAGSAQQRALDAIIKGGELGGNMRTQDFDEKAKAAAAQDEIAKWNAANSQEVRTRNTNRGNTSAEYNLTNAQKLSDANTDTRNKEETYNKGLYQTNYQNQMDVAKAKANARAGVASNLTDTANKTADTWAGIGSGVSKAGAAYMASERPTTRQAVPLEDDDAKKRLAGREY